MTAPCLTNLFQPTNNFPCNEIPFPRWTKETDDLLLQEILDLKGSHVNPLNFCSNFYEPVLFSLQKKYPNQFRNIKSSDVKHRYTEYICPLIITTKSSKLSAAVQKRLFELQKDEGPQWTRIAKILSKENAGQRYYPPVAVKNFFTSLSGQEESPERKRRKTAPFDPLISKVSSNKEPPSTLRHLQKLRQMSLCQMSTLMIGIALKSVKVKSRKIAKDIVFIVSMEILRLIDEVPSQTIKASDSSISPAEILNSQPLSFAGKSASTIQTDSVILSDPAEMTFDSFKSYLFQLLRYKNEEKDTRHVNFAKIDLDEMLQVAGLFLDRLDEYALPSSPPSFESESDEDSLLAFSESEEEGVSPSEKQEDLLEAFQASETEIRKVLLRIKQDYSEQSIQKITLLLFLELDYLEKKLSGQGSLTFDELKKRVRDFFLSQNKRKVRVSQEVFQKIISMKAISSDLFMNADYQEALGSFLKGSWQAEEEKEIVYMDFSEEDLNGIFEAIDVVLPNYYLKSRDWDDLFALLT